MDPEQPDFKGKDVKPSRDRPSVPEIYGIPRTTEHLMNWSQVSGRLRQARIYWIATVSPARRPHATPVDGIWQDETLFFGGSPDTKRHRNLADNPAVCVHLESGTEVVILHGDAENLPDIERSFAVKLAEASQAKYGYGPAPEAYLGGGLFRIRPRKVLAWSRFPSDATRFRFPDR